MKAAYIEKFGSVEEIKIGTLPLPKIKENELLVRVKAVSVNAVDTFIRQGSYPIKTPFPFIIGRDCLGEVVALGKKTTKLKKGDRVWTNAMGYENRQGVTSEYAAIPEDYLFAIPKNFPKEKELSLLAALHSGGTASILCQKIDSKGSLLVTGAAGNVGKALVELATLKGISVTTTSHPKDFPLLKQLGAKETYSYGEHFTDQLQDKRFTTIIDTSGKVTIQDQIKLLADKGTIFLITTPKKSTEAFPFKEFYTHSKKIAGFVISKASKEELQEANQDLNHYFTKGKLLNEGFLVFPMEKAAKAHQKVANHLEKRKILLSVFC